MPRSMFHFADCSVDPAARELRRHGELLEVSPKVFDCLAYLIAHRTRAVGRDELIAAVWGRADVSDTLLGQTMLKARRVIGDTGSGQHMIRTVPRFGYRWVADVHDAPAAQDAPSAAATGVISVSPVESGSGESVDDPAVLPPRIASRVPRRRSVQMAFAVALMAVVALGLTWRRSDERAGAPAAPGIQRPQTEAQAVAMPAADTAAVLPARVSAEADWAWLRLGLMDMVATRLRSAEQRVVPSDNVVALVRAGGGAVNAQDVRRATGARFLIAPEIARIPEGWRVELVLDDEHGERRRVVARGDDAVATARDAADRLLGLLGRPAALDGANLSQVALQQQVDAAVLSDDFPSARALIESAPAALRESPELRLRLALIDYRSGRLGRARERTQTLRDEVTATRDPGLRARVLNTAGAIALMQGRISDADADFTEALALVAGGSQPAVLGQAYTGLAAALADQGRLHEAAVAFGRARVPLELAGDALALARVDANEGMLERLRGRPAVALPLLQRAVARFEQFGALNELFITVSAEVDTHLALLDPAAALALSEPRYVARERLDNAGNRDYLALHHARALAASGRSRQARAILDELAANSRSEPSLAPTIAAARADLEFGAGNAAGAASWAALAVERLDGQAVRLRAQSWLTLVRALNAIGRSQQAAAQVEQMMAWADAHATQPPATLYAALAGAEQDWAAGRRDAARGRYSAALEQAESWGVPADLVLVAVSYAEVLIGNGDTEGASAVAGRVVRWADRDFGTSLLQARLYQSLGQDAAWQASLSRARDLAGDRPMPGAARSGPGEPPAGS